MDIDPELEHWAERVFRELRQAPLVQRSRDLAELIKQRLRQPAEAPPPEPGDESGAGQH